MSTEQYPQGPYPQNPGPQYQAPPPPQYPGPQYQAPPPPKKKRKWPWIALAVLVVLMIVAVAGGGDKEKGEQDATATSGATTTDKAEETKDPGLNTPVRDGKFEFVVTRVEKGLSSVGDNPYLTQKAQGQFVVVSISIKNTSDKPQSFSPSSQKMKDTEGRSFESDTSAQIALQSDIPVYDKINPGNTVRVKLVYDMPKDAVPATIELHDSIFSGGSTVSLK